MSELHVGQRQGRSLSHSDLHLIAHATDAHDVRIGDGYFEYDLHGGVTGAEGHGRAPRSEIVNLSSCATAMLRTDGEPCQAIAVGPSPYSNTHAMATAD